MNNAQRKNLLTSGLNVLARDAEPIDLELAALAESLAAVASDLDVAEPAPAAPRASEALTVRAGEAFPPPFAVGCQQRVFGACAITVGNGGTGHPWAVVTFGGSRSYNFARGTDAMVQAAIETHAELYGWLARLASYAEESGWKETVPAAAELRVDPVGSPEPDEIDVNAQIAQRNEALLERVAESAFAQLASAFEKTCEQYGMPTDHQNPVAWITFQLEDLKKLRAWHEERAQHDEHATCNDRTQPHNETETVKS